MWLLVASNLKRYNVTFAGVEEPALIAAVMEAGLKPDKQLGKWVLAIVFGFLLKTTSCLGEARPLVLSSIKPVQLLVQAIGGSHIESRLLISPGVSPHDFAFSPSSLKSMEGADLVFWVGPEIEAHMAKIMLNKTYGGKSIALGDIVGESEGAVEHSHADHPHQDAHYWLNPKEGLRMGRSAADALVRHDPANAESYRAALAGLETSLQSLDEALRQQLAPVSDRGFIVQHDAYRHFVSRYGLNQVAAYRVTHDREPGLRHVASLRKAIANGEVVCVLLQPQFEVEAMTRLIGDYPVKTALVDPLAMEGEGGEQGYVDYLRNLGQAVADCLAP
jgi:zinc transport system substrate-binding protein